jgi:hypothetical protein
MSEPSPGERLASSAGGTDHAGPISYLGIAGIGTSNHFIGVHEVPPTHPQIVFGSVLVFEVLEYKVPTAQLPVGGLSVPTLQVGIVGLVVNREYPVLLLLSMTGSPRIYMLTVGSEDAGRRVSATSSWMLLPAKLVIPIRVKSFTAFEVWEQGVLAELDPQIWTTVERLLPPLTLKTTSLTTGAEEPRYPSCDPIRMPSTNPFT